MDIKEALGKLKKLQSEVNDIDYAYEALDILSSFLCFELDGIIDAIEEGINEYEALKGE